MDLELLKSLSILLRSESDVSVRSLTEESDEARRRFEDEDLRSGIEDTKISNAINIDAIGSMTWIPVSLMINVDKMTPTEPRVSAKICRKIPCILSLRFGACSPDSEWL
ncbi:hypothetical protein OGATHE_002759 [Ogataea polymorpha]|uniref:Uncharacterized protein n=1 Tax=Ogataea polymorpha TaxID=460523 RepID=A0A9P8T8J8_9ASCO|nr:hypothetical protein OGATHE_002759 [Ogataea polymorpha]